MPSRARAEIKSSDSIDGDPGLFLRRSPNCIENCLDRNAVGKGRRLWITRNGLALNSIAERFVELRIRPEIRAHRLQHVIRRRPELRAAARLRHPQR